MTRVRTILEVAILTAASCAFSSCNLINLITSPNGGKLIPDIPAPASYDAADLVPLNSDILDVSVSPIKNYQPAIDGFVHADGSAATTSTLTRALLVSNGTLVTNPMIYAPAPGTYSYGFSTPTSGPQYQGKTLTKTPYLLLQRYWQRISNVVSYPAGTDTSVTQSYTTGYSSTTGSEFSVSVDASASADFGPASVSVSTDVTTTSSESETYSTEQTSSQTFDVPASSHDVLFDVWILVDRLSIVNADKTPYTDPSYTFDPSSPSDKTDSAGRHYVDIPWGQPHGKTYFF